MAQSIKERDVASSMERALRTVLCLEQWPKCSVEAHVWLLAADGNTLSCAINAASLALCQAAIAMKDLVVAAHAR